MIIFGGGSAHLKTEKVKNAACPSCHTNSSLSLNVFSTNTHIFWIPFFPTGKTATIECNQCKLVMKLKDMPMDIKLKCKDIMRNVKTPIWQFSGLGIFLSIMIWYFFSR